MNDADIRALTEYLTVIPDAPGMYEVVSHSGSTYTVDGRDGACTCPDHEYRDRRCKHIARVELETGRKAIPAWVDPDDLPRDFSAHVERDPAWADDRDLRARVTPVHGGEGLV